MDSLSKHFAFRSKIGFSTKKRINKVKIYTLFSQKLVEITVFFKLCGRKILDISCKSCFIQSDLGFNI